MENVLTLGIPVLYLSHLMVVTTRVGATLMFAPVWGHPGIPASFRILLVFVASAGLAAALPYDERLYANPAILIPAEFVIGLLLSMGIRIVFAGLHLGGQMVGFHLGFASVQSIDPQTLNRSTLMGAFYTLIGTVLLLSSNQHHTIFQAMADSYTAFPVGVMPAAAAWFDTLVSAAGQMFVLGWKIAFPVFLISVVVEASIGFISRMQPQINALVVTAPLKLLLGLMVLGASLLVLPSVLGSAFEAANGLYR